MPFEIHTPPWTSFQELNLDWIVRTVKEYSKKVDDAITSFEDLKNYVDQYLDENTAAAVNAKLEEWLADGTLDAIIADVLNEQLPHRSSVSNGTIQRIAEVAQSYIEHNNDLAYMHHPSAQFNYANGLQADGDYYGWNALQVGENVFTGPSGKNGQQYQDEQGNPKTGMAINCTAFANLVMLGIPYDASRYAAGVDNDTLNVGKAGYCFNPWNGNVGPSPIPTDGVYTGVGIYGNNERMSEFFRKAGLREEMAEDCSNVYPGDIIWQMDHANNIYHCAIVIAKYPSSVNETYPVLLYAECNNSSMPCQYKALNLSELIVNGSVDSQNRPNGWYYVGHPVYQTVDPTANEVIIEQKTGFATMRWDVSKLDVRSSDLLTISLDWTPASATEFLNIQMATADDALATVYRLPYPVRAGSGFTPEVGKTYHISFPFTPRSSGIITGSRKTVTVIAINSNNASGTNNATVTNCKIIRGLPGVGEEEKLFKPSTVADLEDMVTDAYPLAVNHYASVNKHFTVAPSAALTISGMTISNNYATEGDAILVSYNGALVSGIIILHAVEGEAILTYSGGQWS